MKLGLDHVGHFRLQVFDAPQRGNSLFAFLTNVLKLLWIANVFGFDVIVLVIVLVAAVSPVAPRGLFRAAASTFAVFVFVDHRRNVVRDLAQFLLLLTLLLFLTIPI